MASRLFVRSYFPAVTLRQKHEWSKDNVVKSPCKDIVIPEVTVKEFFWRNLDKWATKTAMVCGITNRRYTYNELHKHTQILAAILKKKFNINDGDTVGLMSHNVPEYPIVALGAVEAGAVLTTLNPLYTAYETRTQFLLSELKVIFAHPDVVQTVKEALKLCKMKIPIVCLDINSSRPNNTVSYKELVVDSHVDLDILKGVKRKPDDVAFLLYSSGTTGLPKGVELTHRNIVANCSQQDTELRHYDPDASYQQSQLLVLPMYHSYCLTVGIIHKMANGLKSVVLPKFQPDTFLNAAQKNKINMHYLVPPMVLFLGSHPQVTPEIFEPITCILCGAAPTPLADIENMFEKAQQAIPFCLGYGLTETSPGVTTQPLGVKEYITSGYPLPNIQLRLVDGEMNNLGINEVGEILIKGPNVMKGYKNNPEANKQVFVEERWLRSGDLGSIDEEGRLTITGRLKELIKVKGYLVPPAELESIVKQHPAVFDAAVIGVPDAYSGEKPKAYVMLKEGVIVTDNEIMDFVNKQVAPYKKIKELSFIDNIPKNNSGKIMRRVLTELHNEQ